MATTKHTCGGPSFGRKTPGCPRCDELLAGAKPVTWGPTRAQEDAERAKALRVHFAPGHDQRCPQGQMCQTGQW